MASDEHLKILNLTTHLNVGGISNYLAMTGSRLVRMGHEVVVVSSGGNFKEVLEKKGIRCLDISIRTKNELHPKIFFALPKMIRLVKQEKFDLIHAHTRVTQVLGSLVAKFTGVPLVTTSHGFFKPRLSRRWFGCWGKTVIAISPLVAEDLEQSHRVKRSKIRIVQNAIDLEDFEARLFEKDPAALRESWGITQGMKVVSSISRLVRDKGHDYLIRAVGDLKKKKEDFYLLIAGEGRERKNLEKLIQKSGLEKQARIIDTRVDVTSILSVTDIFVHPATYREGFGLVIVEAMVAKKPVIATNIRAVNSLVRNRVNGFLVEPKNGKELAEAIQFIVANPKITVSIVENAYRSATELYSIDRMVSELETVYEEAARRA